MLDPVCDMIVDLSEQREQGLTIERPEREYAFCSAGCLEKFARDPNATYQRSSDGLRSGSLHRRACDRRVLRRAAS